jgi:hypothetical protein
VKTLSKIPTRLGIVLTVVGAIPPVGLVAQRKRRLAGLVRIPGTRRHRVHTRLDRSPWQVTAMSPARSPCSTSAHEDRGRILHRH